ncbi:unnamed protein product [Rotaria socialis]
MSDGSVSTMEMLPNELILNICRHFTARELYRAFYGLNRRFSSIADNISDLHLTITNNESHEPVWLAFSRVIKLKIENAKQIDLYRFSNIRSLTWIRPSAVQLQKLCSFTYFAYLEQLRVYDIYDMPSAAHFHQFVFSNGFPRVRILSLSHINISSPWAISLCLRAINAQNVRDPHLYERILISCPNLTRLDFHMLRCIEIPMPVSFQHVNLKRLHCTGTLSSRSLENILAIVPGLMQFNINGSIREQPLVYFERLGNTLNVFLPHLNRFDCNFLFTGQYADLIKTRSFLEKFHPCFKHRMKFTKLSYGRIRIHTKSII